MSSKHHADWRHIGGLSPTSCIRLALILCSWSLSWALPLQAANKTWTNPVTGSWTTAANWTGGVPTATDSATFNQAGDYTVNFSSVFQSLNNMSFSAGTVTFERLASPATLQITDASGGRDLTIGNATLNMGQSLTVNITVGDDVIINSGGTINVRAGSFLNPQDLFVNAGGTLSLANGTITPSGTAQIDGTLTVSNGGDVNSGSAFMGAVAGSTGTATVTGAGSTWMNTNGAFVVGELGNGVLTVQSGGTVVGNIDFIGNVASSTGMATIYRRRIELESILPCCR